MSKFITSSTSSSNFICASSMPKKKKKSISSFRVCKVSIFNYIPCKFLLLLTFLFKFKIYVGYKRYLTNLKQNKYLFIIRVKRVVISGSFRVDTNKLACQTYLLRVTRVDPFMTRFLSCRFRVDPFITQTH